MSRFSCIKWFIWYTNAVKM